MASEPASVEQAEACVLGAALDGPLDVHNRVVVSGVELSGGTSYHRISFAMLLFKNCFILYIRFVSLNSSTGQHARAVETHHYMYRQQWWSTPQVNYRSDVTYKNVTAYISHLILKLSIGLGAVRSNTSGNHEAAHHQPCNNPCLES